ncbi:MAG TPA: glycosyltransferase [Solirubrobacterales bacterium]|jgi:glycosyltransferase involved in cell wall biosynthesis
MAAAARSLVDDLRRRRVLRRRRPPQIRVGAGAGERTIYYLCPDYPVPSGGIRVIYRHVDALNEAGRPAAVLHHADGFRCDWFENRTRVIGAPSVELGPADVLVVPEVYGPFLDQLPRGPRRVAFNQNGYLTFQYVQAGTAPAYGGFEAAMTVSEDSAEMLRFAFPGLRVEVVPNSVDPGLFREGPETPGRRLAYMPRKRPRDAELIFRLLGERLAGWEVTPIEGASEEETAAMLRAAPVFLALGFREGFGLPAAEAMASGCFVVGFPGFGGREVFDPSFSVAVEDGDVLGAAKALAAACERFESDPEALRADGARAAAAIRERWSRANQEARLLEFFDRLG